MCVGAESCLKCSVHIAKDLPVIKAWVFIRNYILCWQPNCEENEVMVQDWQFS